MGFARLFRPRYARTPREHWGTHSLRCVMTAFYVVVAVDFVPEMLSVLTQTLKPVQCLPFNGTT
jgi:uncharacterized membrane protein YkvA (DUF1232 family)